MWLLLFNADKWPILTLGKIDNIVHNHRYELYDEELEHVFEETDLGVTIDHELKFVRPTQLFDWSEEASRF